MPIDINDGKARNSQRKKITGYFLPFGLYMVRLIPCLAQPWGGATAIWKTDFHRLGVADRWSSSIVDDVTLAALLEEKGLKVVVPNDADLKTVVEDCSWQAWQCWLIRQWAYLKFLFPRLWLAAGLAEIGFTLLLYCSLVVVLAWGLEIFADRLTVLATGYLALIGAVAGLLRLRHPAPGPIALWYPGFIAAVSMAGWCHCRTWFSDSITWAGIEYTVAAGGKVVDINRSQEVKMQEKRG